jgi:hypothetical protein
MKYFCSNSCQREHKDHQGLLSHRHAGAVHLSFVYETMSVKGLEEEMRHLMIRDPEIAKTPRPFM